MDQFYLSLRFFVTNYKILHNMVMNCPAIQFYDFWQNMTEYIIHFMERKHHVFLLDYNGTVEDVKCVDGIYIFPDSTSVFDVTARSYGEYKYELWEVSILLGFFYGKILGCPRSELAVKFNSASIRLEIFDTPPGFYGVKLGNCKLLFTTTYVAPDLTEHTLYTVYASGVYRVIRVKNPVTLSLDILPTLRSLKGLPTALGVIALSDSTLVFDGGKITPFAVIGAALCVLDGNGGSTDLYYREMLFKVSLKNETATLLTPLSLIKTSKI